MRLYIYKVYIGGNKSKLTLLDMTIFCVKRFKNARSQICTLCTLVDRLGSNSIMQSLG